MNKLLCLETVKWILKRHNFIWKRMRNSLKTERDHSLFEWLKEELSELKKLVYNKEIDLCCFDETGLNLKPNVPYGWQLKGSIQ